MRRLAVGCGTVLLSVAACGLLGYLAAAFLAAVGGSEAVEMAVLIGATALLVGFSGIVLLWAAMPTPATTVDHAVGRHPTVVWLVVFALVLAAGQVTLLSGPLVTGFLLPPLHFLAALLPALAVTGAMAWRPKLTGLAYGSCGAATAALAIEAVLAGVLGVVCYLALNSSPEGQAVLETLRRLADASIEGAEPDAAVVGRLLVQPAILVAVFGLMGLLGPFVEETVKMAGVAARGPKNVAHAWSWGVAAGAGFGMTEAVVLGAMSITAWPPAMLLRASATLMHATMTGVAAVGWYRAVSEGRWRRGLATLALAVLGHMAWNILVLVAAMAQASTQLGGPPWTGTVAAASSVGLVVLLAGIVFSFVAKSVTYGPRGPLTPRSGPS